MKSIALKILTIIEWTIIAVIAVVFLIVTSSLIPGSYIGKSYIVVSESMQPTIPVGSMVVTVPQQAYEISDIIAFESPEDTDKIIMHRAYRRNAENTGWITKGDGNEEVDKWIIADPMIRGRAVGFIPHIGTFAAEARSPRGFLLYIGLPVLLIMVLYCFKIIRGVKEYARQEAAKAVEAYRKSHTLRQITLSMLLLMAIPTLLTMPYAYAMFSDKVTTELLFVTAETFTTPTPEPTIQPTVLPTSETSATPTPQPTTEPTASPTPTSTPTPSPSLTPTPHPSGGNGTIILNQTGPSTTINVNATTHGGSVSVGVNSQVTSHQSQSVTIHNHTTTQQTQQ